MRGRRTPLALALVGYLALTSCTYEVFTDRCWTREEVPPDQPCPTPVPFEAFDLEVREVGFEPLEAFQPVCDAFAIVEEVIQPAYAMFEAEGFVDSPEAVAEAGNQIVDAGVEIEQLAEETDGEPAASLRQLGTAFQTEGRRAAQGDLSDRSARELFWDQIRRHGNDCFGLHPSERPLTRAALADRLVDEFDIPDTDGDFFTDDEESGLESEINRAAAAGVATGCTETTYCPDEPVSRGILAEFLSRALRLPETDVDAYDDDNGSRYEPFINRMAAAGMVAGHRSGEFRPNVHVTQRQLDDFMSRARYLIRGEQPPDIDD